MAPPTTTADRAQAWLHTTKGDRVTLHSLTEALGEQGFGFLLLALTLPNITIIPSVPLLPLIPGIPAIILCLQMAAGRHAPALPGWAATLSVRKAHAAKCIRVARKLSSLARPRLPWLTGSLGVRVLGGIGAALTVALCLPLPGLNLLPGVGMLALAVGLAEEDGLIAASGAAIGLVGSVSTLFVLARLFTNLWVHP